MSLLFRYTDIKEDIAEELENLRDEGKALENVNEYFVFEIFQSHKILKRNCQKEFLQRKKKKYFHCCLKFMNWKLTRYYFCEKFSW